MRGGEGGGPETPVRGLFVSPLTHEGLLHGQAKQGSANLHDSRSASHKDDGYVAIMQRPIAFYNR